MTALPLDDVRVVDMTVARSGPTCVRQLADWGADVVRVERGSAGLLGHRRGSDAQNLHRNIRSISLDLREPAGMEVLLRLVDKADIFVENMRPEVKRRRGFDFATLQARNPRLVYGSISGFGQDGPYADRGGLDQVAQGIGGLMSVTGEIGGQPLRAGIPVSDLASGLYLAIGLLVALHDRERTGQGRWVQTSLLEAMVAMMDFQATRWTIDGQTPSSEGNHHPTMVPMGCFATADGYVNIAAPGGHILDQFYAVTGLRHVADDPRFATLEERSANRDHLNHLISERLLTRTTEDWVRALNDAGVPCGPVYGMDETFSDPQVRHLGLATTVNHPSLGPIDLVRNAVTMDGITTVRTPAPDAGQHTAQVLGELGYDPEQVARFQESGVFQ